MGLFSFHLLFVNKQVHIPSAQIIVSLLMTWYGKQIPHPHRASLGRKKHEMHSEPTTVLVKMTSISLPKQTPRWGTKALQAVAMASSAESIVLMIRSSTLAIRAGKKKTGKNKKANEALEARTAYSDYYNGQSIWIWASPAISKHLNSLACVQIILMHLIVFIPSFL